MCCAGASPRGREQQTAGQKVDCKFRSIIRRRRRRRRQPRPNRQTDAPKKRKRKRRRFHSPTTSVVFDVDLSPLTSKVTVLHLDWLKMNDSHRVFTHFSQFNLVFSCFTLFYQVLLGSTSFYLVLLIYQVLLRFT